MNYRDYIPSIIPLWVKALGVLAVVVFILAPYAVIHHYKPLYSAALLDVKSKTEELKGLKAERDALEAIRLASNAAMAKLRNEQLKADTKRRVAEVEAQKKAVTHDNTIIDIKVKLKEPQDANTNCKQVEDLIDSFIPPIRLRNDTGEAGSSGDTRSGEVRNNPDRAPSTE